MSSEEMQDSYRGEQAMIGKDRVASHSKTLVQKCGLRAEANAKAFKGLACKFAPAGDDREAAPNEGLR